MYQIFNKKNIYLISNQFILNFKFIVKNKKESSLLFSPLLLSLFLPIIFIPLTVGFPIVVQTGVIIPAGLLFVFTSYNIRKSTMYSNLKTTGNNKYNFYISILFFVLVTAFILALVQLTALEILAQTKKLETAWVSYDLNYKYLFFNKKILTFFVSVFEMTIIMFSLLFFLSQVINSKKTMYIIILVISILNIIFGGPINNYMWVSGNPTGKVYMNKFEETLFPDFMFYPSMIYPFFSPGELLITFGGISLKDINTGETFFANWAYVNPLQWQHLKDFPMFKDDFDNMWQWNFVLIMPLLQIVFFGTLGVIFNKITNK